MKTHPKLVSVLTLIWLVVFTKLVYAASVLPPFSQDVRGFDVESALYAAGAGLLGGAGRTIYSLASDKVLVGNLWRESIKDAIVALIGGIITWAVVTCAANFWPTLFTSSARMLLVIAAGASRGKWAVLLGNSISNALALAKVKFFGTHVPVRVKAADPQPSAVVPLETQK